MEKALVTVLFLIAFPINIFAEIVGQQRSYGWQPPDIAAEQALADARAAYQTLQLQEAQEEAQAEALQAQREAEELERQQQIENQLEGLKQNATKKTLDAELAELSVSNVLATIFQNKKLIPRDPWRQILSTAKYVKSPGSGFIKFYGVILQATKNGVLMDGNYLTPETNFFVEDFPYRTYNYSVGDNLFDTTNIYVAYPAGLFTYLTIDGSKSDVFQNLVTGTHAPARRTPALLKLPLRNLLPTKNSR